MTDAITNRADRALTRRVDFPCRCPGTPHTQDSADLAVLLGYGDRGTIRQATRLGGIEAGFQMLILLGVRSWTLTLPDGSARPVSAEEVALLDEGTVDYLVAQFTDALAERPLGKASAAPSRGGTPASPTRTRRTPRRLRSMTA